ncbi:MAG: alpha/beta hydrolase-fold protein [Galactobacter sp.]
MKTTPVRLAPAPTTSTRSRRLTAGLAVAGLAIFALGSVPSASAQSSGAAAPPGAAPAVTTASQQKLGPTVRATGSSPTGYEVTFRFLAPDAKRMHIEGQWFFSDEDNSSGTLAESRTPLEWKPGDFPLAYPAQVGANGPVRAMTKGKGGVWSYTTPLPSGTWNYYFYKDCETDDVAECETLTDPANPHWNTDNGSKQFSSQVYVPSDPDFGSEDLSWQAPTRKHGTLVNLTYDSLGATKCTNPALCTSDAGEHDVAVYLPPGYNAKRKVAYPTIYLSHGSGGNEVNWSTETPGGNILDNAVNSKLMQPAVVVMVNWNNIDGTGPAAAYKDLAENVIPFIEGRFNVSKDASARSLGGLSAGGERTSWVLANHADQFDYYGAWSTGGSYPVTDDNREEISAVAGIHVGGGKQDPIFPRSQALEENLKKNDISYRPYNINGGHDTPVWRKMLYDFVQNTAFRQTSTSAELGTVRGKTSLTADVTPGTANVAAPTGTVEFSLVSGSQEFPVGSAKLRKDGTAVLPLGSPRNARAAQSGITVKAVYSGDRFYNASQTAD